MDNYTVEETPMTKELRALFELQASHHQIMITPPPIELVTENRGRVWPDHTVGVNAFLWRGGYGV